MTRKEKGIYKLGSEFLWLLFDNVSKKYVYETYYYGIYYLNVNITYLICITLVWE